MHRLSNEIWEHKIIQPVMTSICQPEKLAIVFFWAVFYKFVEIIDFNWKPAWQNCWEIQIHLDKMIEKAKLFYEIIKLQFESVKSAGDLGTLIK